MQLLLDVNCSNLMTSNSEVSESRADSYIGDPDVGNEVSTIAKRRINLPKRIFFLAVNAATVKLPEIQFALHGITSSSTVSPPSTTNAAQHLTDIIAKPHRKV